MLCSKHKGVSWRDRPKKPWQAIVKGTYLGCFATEEEAAKAAGSLQLEDTESPQPKDIVRTHRFIYWHRRDQVWHAKIRSKHVGFFHDHGSALADIMKATGLQEKALLLNPKEVRKSVRGQRDAVPKRAHCFHLLYSAYKNLEKGRSIAGNAYPGDLEDMHSRAAKDAKIFKDPNFIVCMMLAKFGPHRDALQTAHHRNPKPKSADDAIVCRWVYDVMVDALELLAAVSDAEMQPWIDGPGKQTTYHSGLVVYANTALKILNPLDDANPLKRKYGATPKKTKVLVFGKQRRHFQVQVYSITIQKILIQVRIFGQALLEAKPPKSLEEWKQAMEDLRAKVRKAPGIPNCHCYRYTWVARGFWDFQLRRAKIPPGISYRSTAKVLYHSYHSCLIHFRIFGLFLANLIS